LLRYAYLYRNMYKTSTRTALLSAEVFPYKLFYIHTGAYISDGVEECTTDSGEAMNAAACDQGKSRNAARFGGHNIFPMGPEVVVRSLGRPRSTAHSSTIKAIEPSFHNTRMLLPHTDDRDTSCIKDLSSQVGRAAAMRQNCAHTSRIRRPVCCLY
jgi:hypothetical protein